MGRKGQSGKPSEARKAKMRARAAAFQLQQAQAAADAQAQAQAAADTQAQAQAAADAQAQTAAQPLPQLKMSSNAEAMDLTSSTDKETKGTFGSNVTSASRASLGIPERKDVGTQTQLSCGCHAEMLPPAKSDQDNLDNPGLRASTHISGDGVRFHVKSAKQKFTDGEGGVEFGLCITSVAKISKR